MTIIQLTKENIETEHICCAITEKKGENCVSSKKEWIKEQFENGLTFRKLDARGKVFIEYIPAENAWAPVDAKNYMYINCFWVSGRYKGQGHANALLKETIAHAKKLGKAGLVILSSDKKRPFLSDPKYLKYKGFKVCDSAPPYFKLMYLPFDDKEKVPHFKKHIKGNTSVEGIVLYYSHQCPFVTKYVDIIDKAAKRDGIDLKLIHITTLDQAKEAPSPFTTYSLFINGHFITNEILTEKRFLSIVSQHTT